MDVNKWKVALVVGVGAFFIAATPTLAKWSDDVVLPSLADYNIFGLTSDLVDQTGDMLDDTRKLESEVSKAESAMAGLDRQNTLLKQQIETNESINKELNGQLNGNIVARELMKQILSREGKTADLSKQIASTGDEVTGQMITTVNHMGKVADHTGQLNNTTGQLNNRMDVLLAELDKSIRNFRFVSRIPLAIRYLEDKFGVDLPVVPRDSNSDNQNPVDKVKKPVDDVLDGLPPDRNKNSEDNDSGGLSDWIPILP
ncbi:hypothetical protein GCM10011571_31660 [Marinithermofilum abyssi]|uniref:Uncharacterized protein n=1 Tax=Marinithermofilum abyssi TaxID=1571185 RepID=A0A8J2VJF1_9BACL|nr:hypothetical protein [Marinithermofilum abyssi]GGE27118.1 hypothetical protein GCM10011571_31660 [Marinithermofilum abyssi]